MRGRYSSLTAIVLGGGVAGIVDLGAASLITWLSPLTIMQAVAGGVLGRATYAAGAESMALGFVLHMAMAVLIAAIYVAASAFLPFLKKQWALWGLAYGVGVFFVMNYVVVPLSAIGRVPRYAWYDFSRPLEAWWTPDGRWFVLNMAAMVLFGLIVAFFARAERTAPTA